MSKKSIDPTSTSNVPLLKSRSPPASNAQPPSGFTMRGPSTPITMIVACATSPPLGIGRAGTLPWPMLKTDMSFFARVTKRTRLPPSPPSPSTAGTRRINAVLMGRKTYFSIPAHLRPLAGRLNVIVTRQEPGALQEKLRADVEDVMRRREREGKKQVAGEPGTMHVASSVESGIKMLHEAYGGRLECVFVIGGAEIYKSVLALQGSNLRAVVTQVRRKDGEAFECDTFFPVDLEKALAGWKRVETETVNDWVGEKVMQEWTQEGETGVKIRMVGFERTAG